MEGSSFEDTRKTLRNIIYVANHVPLVVVTAKVVFSVSFGFVKTSRSTTKLR